MSRHRPAAGGSSGRRPGDWSRPPRAAGSTSSGPDRVRDPGLILACAGSTLADLRRYLVVSRSACNPLPHSGSGTLRLRRRAKPGQPLLGSPQPYTPRRLWDMPWAYATLASSGLCRRARTFPSHLCHVGHSAIVAADRDWQLTCQPVMLQACALAHLRQSALPSHRGLLCTPALDEARPERASGRRLSTHSSRLRTGRYGTGRLRHWPVTALPGLPAAPARRSGRAQRPG